jgi:chromate reductase, NAD(P)H dehydrogenase (quinone)
MTDVYQVAVLAGSLRKESINRKVAHALIELAPSSLRPAIVEIGALPLYNQDSEATPPTAWTQFREAIKAVQAVLFVTPEYNRSIPAAMKNAVDVGSRPYGQNVWNAKPGGVVSASPGTYGGFGANHHLRQSLMAVNVRVMPQPEVYLSAADKLLDADGKIANQGTREFLQKFMHAFAAWIATNAQPHSGSA